MGDFSNFSKRKLETPKSVFHPKLGKFVDLTQTNPCSTSSSCQVSSSGSAKQKQTSNVGGYTSFPVSIRNTLIESFVTRKIRSQENATSMAAFPGNWSVMGKSRFYKHVDCIEDMKQNTLVNKSVNNSITSQKLIEYCPEKRPFKLSDAATLDWKNPVLGNIQKSVSSATTSKVISRNNFDKIYSSFRFSKEMLKNAIVLGQVDDKFIACRFLHNEHDVLVLIDQHAAHERIRLEKLLQQIGYYEPDSSKAALKHNICRLSPPVELLFTDNEVDMLLHYSAEFQNVGIKYSMCKSKFGKASVSSMYRVIVSSVPSIFVNVCEPQVKAKGGCVNPSLLKEYMIEQGTMMRSCAVRCKIASPVVFKVLASYACHGAIKFGDKLNRDVYVKLVLDLSKCQLPFQCAHGRPAIAPLFHLSMLAPFLKQNDSNVKKPNLRRLTSKMNSR